jgi:DNA-binding transcriptional LysR family regulator
MTTDDIEYLLAVAQHRNIGRAAEALGLTQPALTRAVARIEVMVGQRLFTRHPKGVEPTPAGEAFLLRVGQMRMAYDDALRELHQMKAGQLGLLRAGYSPSVDEDVLVSAARRLLLERPAAQLRLVERLTQTLLAQLAEGELDLVVGPAPDPLPVEFEASVLYQSQMHVIADRDHPLQRPGARSLAEVVQEPWLLSAPRTPLRRDIDAILASHGLPALTVRVESDSLAHAQFALLRGTRMLGLCSDWWLKVVRRMGLERLDVAGLHVRRQIAVLRRRGSYLSPLSSRLTELLTSEIQRRRPAMLGTGLPPVPLDEAASVSPLER